MLFENIKYIDENYNIIDDAYVGIVDDKIEYLSTEKPKDPSKYGEIYNGDNKLLMPGLYNVHSHAAATILRSYADNQTLADWLNNWIFPFEAKMNGEDYYWATALGLAEMARYGIVSCSDMYFEGNDRMRAIVESKMKCNMCECIVSFEDIAFEQHPLYKTTVNLVNEFNNYDNERIKIDANIHGEYTTKEKICRGVGEFAKDNNLVNHIHVSETQSEHEECKQRHNGKTPIEYFESIGVLDSKVLIAHGVWLEKQDLEIMKQRGVSLATCPASNLKLGSGIAQLPDVINGDINLCMGTDGVASNNNYNMFQDMYLVALLNRGVLHNPTLMPVKQVMYIATQAGAIAQNRQNCGAIKIGNKADLCVMDLSETIWCPDQNILNNLIYSGQGSDICLTMVDGRIVYKDGDWPLIDIEKIKYEVNQRRKRIISEL